MKSKITLAGLLCLVMLAATPLTVFAAPIDDIEVYDPTQESTEVVFTADENDESETGTGSGNTESEEEQSISSQNTSISNELQSMIQSLIEKNVEKKTVVYIPGRSVVIREDIPITLKELMPIIITGMKYMDVPRLVPIIHEVPSASQTDNTNKAIEEIKKSIIGEDAIIGSLPFELGDMDITEFLRTIETIGWPEELITAWEEILRNYMVPSYRVDLVGGGFVDWPYLELRYEVLEAYVNSLAMSDQINTTNIIEYRVSKEVEQKIVNKQPVGEYRWEIFDQEGKLLKTTYTYGRILRLSFSKPGIYYIKAFQKHYVTRADVVSTQKLEYWMIAETRQLLWKTQTDGKQFTYNRNVAEEFLQTNYIQQEVTPAMIGGDWIAALDPTGQLHITEGFSTERLK